MKCNLLLLAVSVLMLAGCSENAAVEQLEQPAKQMNVDVVAENLSAPWAITKSNDTFYITERTGSIVQITEEAMKRQNVTLEKQLSSVAEAGLLGLVLAPNFSSTNEAYAYYTYDQNGVPLNRVVLLELVDDTWHERSVLIDEIPSGTYHHGGRLKIGPDQLLYITTGDASNPEFAQDQDSLAGKILRLNLDGSIPKDNPFHSPIYSLGHRNPQGVAWSSQGQMYASEHGQSANDEINEITPGKNYGWPIIEGTQKQEGLEHPLFTSGNDHTWAPSGMAAQQDMLYVAALRGTALLEFDLQARTSRELVNDVGRIRDVWLEGDSLYFITNNTDGRGQPIPTDDRLIHLQLEHK